MSLLFIDSFDHYSTSQITRKWTGALDCQITPGAGRNGTNGLTVGHYVTKTLAGLSTAILGVAIKVKPGVGAFGQIFGLLQAGSFHCKLVVLPDLTLSVQNYAGTTLGTSVVSLQEDVYAYVEFKAVLPGGSAGSYAVRKDGLPVLSGTGLMANPNLPAVANQIRLGFNPGLEGLFSTVDDFYLCDATGSVNNDFLGDVMIRPLYPTGAGATTQWSPLSGTNWSQVSEHPPDDDTTYNGSGIANTTDLYTLTQITGTPPTIKGVQWNGHLRKDDASSYVLNRAVRSGTTTFFGSASLTPNTSYSNYTEALDLDPNTGTAWTQATVNAMQAGQKLVSVV